VIAERMDRGERAGRRTKVHADLLRRRPSSAERAKRRGASPQTVLGLNAVCDHKTDQVKTKLWPGRPRISEGHYIENERVGPIDRCASGRRSVLDCVPLVGAE
jgi:hypothetical protein